MSSRIRIPLALCVLALLAPAGAAAQGASFIDGNPLDVYADGRGRFQVLYGEDAEFAGGASRLTPDAGLNLATYYVMNPAQSGPLFGFLGPSYQVQDSNSGEFTNTSPPTVVFVNGARALRSVYQSAVVPTFTDGPVQITEHLFYTDGDTHVRAVYGIRNTSTSQIVRVRASLAGNIAHGAASDGSGFSVPGPPYALGGVNDDKGAAVSLADNTASPGTYTWNGWEADDVGTVFGRIRAPAGGGFDGTVAVGPFDDAVGAQWDFRTTPIAANSTQTVEALWRFSRFDGLMLSPADAPATVGEAHGLTAIADGGGTAAPAGRVVRWRSDGANPDAGVVLTDARGHAELTLRATVPGVDTVTVYVDRNEDGTRQASEALRTATVRWQPGAPPPLRRGESVNAEVVEGEVLVAEPTVTPRQRRGAGVAAVGAFRKLEGSQQIPVGSLVDTSAGTVKLTSARDRLGTTTQSSNFKGGLFKVRQSRRRALTEMIMRGGSRAVCRSSSSTATTARRVIRRLRGSGRGRFRTRGRHSSATVRGTVWTLKETCAGTLTTVQKGSVKVRDFERKRTVTVRKGRSYLARPRR